ncbi:MAG TPA: ribosomal protein S18-alanine N-acetyltransferase [Candidatus Binataceae bacterium]|nr:ribosomal protein S18-alanine N-acetyltransferase [Candidatus Binataceae bacterium]
MRINAKQDLNIREATIADLPRIMAIEEIAFEHPWSRESFQREFALPFSKTWVATLEESSSIVGYLCRWLVTDECHILNVAVDPNFRCAGIGTLLMGEAIAEAAMNKAAIMTLEVRRSNLAARSLYRKLQFEERRLRKNYYGVGEDAIIMERQL